MFAEILQRVRDTRPLIHSITNYVTVNDCANILLACGASPIMADDPEEVEEITAGSAGLTLNLGTLHRQRAAAMLAAGRTANRLGRPVVLDPVGVGASRLRGEAAAALLEQVRFAVIRGNGSEIRTLALGQGGERGVDADEADRMETGGLDGAQLWAARLARRTGAVVAVTGVVDVVTDGTRTFRIRNGHPMMSRVTGTGCQLSGLAAAFTAASPGTPLEAAAGAVCAMGVCGELAFARMGPEDGNAAYRGYLMDAMYNLTPEQLEERADYELR